MKKILLLIFVFALAPIGAFAKCSGDDIGTDYWGRTYGCACSGGGVDEQKSRGNRILAELPGKELRCSGCWLFCNDRWDTKDGGWCTDNPTVANPSLVTVRDEKRKCWRKQCPEGSYFPGDPSGKIDYTTCRPCSGMSETVSDGICWNVLCGSGNSAEDKLTRDKIFGSEVVIFNGKCMPVCDLQTSGAVYSDTDSTFISIEIKRKNAGTLGKVDTDVVTDTVTE